MDIANVVRRGFPGPGGIATMLRVVTTTLARGHHVRVWAARVDDAPITRLNATLSAQPFAPFWTDGVEVRPIPRDPLARAAAAPMALLTVPGFRGKGYQAVRHATAPGYVRAVARGFARDWGTPDVVHCWGGEHANWAAGHAARAAGRPLVVTPFAHPKAWGDDDMNVAFYKSADIVCALLPSEAGFYASVGVPRERLRVVGVPVTPLPADGPDVRARHGIGDAPLVLYLGLKEPYKGYARLLAAAEDVWASHPDARLAFVGPRTPSSEADFAAVRDERVIEVGLVDDAEVAAWHRAATVYCLPSVSEIMPVAILEAWQQGVPVVATEWWCARDLVEDGHDGLVVRPEPDAIADAVVSLLADPSRARAMGEAGKRKVAERYTPEAVAARHVAAYEDATRARD